LDDSVPAVRVNSPIPDPAATVTEVGTAKPGNPLLLNVTAAPPVGAILDSVTVQSLVVFDPSVIGLHCKDESTVAVTRLKFTDCDVPL
jgi:hypothetical protein